jgi:hypothetical protein
MFDQARDLFETHPLLGLVVVELITGVCILALVLLDSSKERKAFRRAARECRELERLFSL